MSKIEYSSESLPTPDEFRRRLREAHEQYDPVETLLTLQRELIALETKHAITSDVAYQRYQAGEAGDTLEFIWWVGRYRQYMQLKSTISDSLQLVVAAPSATPIPL